MNIAKKISDLKTDFKKQIAKATTPEKLEELRIDFLGRSGSIAAITNTFKTLSIEEKKEIGPQLQEFKKWAQEQYELKKTALEKLKNQAIDESKRSFDVTAYKPNQLYGSLHIYTRITEHINAIFTSMGYAIADGPEVETDYYNFKALNIPDDHPARDMHDTFWLFNPGYLLRTHTSNVQIRTLENSTVPLAIASPGRVFRNESIDASHNFMFRQVEALFVDKDVSLSNLLATAKTFLQHLFEKPDLDIRVRPGYFPFVEPGLEIDASCPFCKKGCSICKKTGWIELLGSGLVHPNVLTYCGIDPEKYSGFAFGMGIDRFAMIKYGITDIRLFQSANLHFLSQF